MGQNYEIYVHDRIARSQIESQVIAGKSHDMGKYFLEEHNVVNIRQFSQFSLNLRPCSRNCLSNFSLLLLLLSHILELVKYNI